MRKINNLVDSAIDVIIETSDSNRSKIKDIEILICDFKDIINNIYLSYPLRNSILDCLTEGCLCLEHSMFAAMSGFYSPAFESLRKIIELSIFGINFDKNNIKYTDWIAGNPEFRFSEKLKEIYLFAEISQWNSIPSCSTLRGDILTQFQNLSKFTHSNPTTWIKDQRNTWKLVFSDDLFDIWYETTKKTVELSATITLLYLSELIDDSFVKIVSTNISTDITMSKL